MNDTPLTLAELDGLCRRVYTIDKWARFLAHDLSKATGREVSPSQVNHWQSAKRPVPVWVELPFPRAFRARYARWGKLAMAARAVADELDAAFKAFMAAQVGLDEISDTDLNEATDLEPGM